MPDSMPEPREQASTESVRRPKATRISEDSITFRWIVPAALTMLAIITLLLFLAAIAVIFDIFPRG